MDERKILEAIEGLRLDIGGRLDSIERRLSGTEEQQRKQQKDIETLFERLDALCEDKPIWRSKDRREVGVRQEDAYKVFKKLGYSRREAMHLLDKTGRLSRNAGDAHLTKMVRSPELGRTRAVVIFVEGS